MTVGVTGTPDSSDGNEKPSDTKGYRAVTVVTGRDRWALYVTLSVYIDRTGDR